MSNFVRGRRVGRWAVQVSGAPFLFCRFVSLAHANGGVALRFRQYELAVYPWPF